MPCSQTLAGIARDCASNMGGIKTVYIANAADVDSVTLTSGVVTAITMASGKHFYKYAFSPNTSSLSSNWQVNADNGTKFVESDLLMVFNRMDSTKRLEIMALAQTETAIVVEDNNGNMWYLGHDYPVTINAGDGLTGTARGDRNGYSVTLRDESNELPMPFTGTVPTA
jgi:hypothetical protein